MEFPLGGGSAHLTRSHPRVVSHSAESTAETVSECCYLRTPKRAVRKRLGFQGSSLRSRREMEIYHALSNSADMQGISILDYARISLLGHARSTPPA